MTKIGTIFQNAINAVQYLSGVAKQRKSGISTYQLAFNRESDDCWYIDLPEWNGAHASLRMVAGADKLLDYVGSGNPRVEIMVFKSNVPSPEMDSNSNYFRCDYVEGSTVGLYQVNLKGFNRTM